MADEGGGDAGNGEDRENDDIMDVWMTFKNRCKIEELRKRLKIEDVRS